MAKTDEADASSKKGILPVDFDMTRLGVYAGGKCFCIHPEIPLAEVPKTYLRETVRSPFDEVCNFCGHVCMNGSARDKRSSAHYVGTDFMYCPHKGKAFRTPIHPSGELCAECGVIIEKKSSAAEVVEYPLATCCHHSL